MGIASILLRATMVAAACGSILTGALPVARHMSGVVALDAPLLPPRRSAPAAREPDLAAVLAFAPFGRGATAEVAQTRTAPRPDIALKGVFVANGAMSSAHLEVGGVVGLFREGMVVAGALTVTKIALDHVRLQDEASALTLRFDGETSDPSPAPKQDLLARMGAGLVVPAAYQPPKAPETTSEYIDYWRTRIRKNPKAVLDAIGLEPSANGYVIAARHDVGVQLAGLRAGDLVRTVNGRAVGDPAEDRKLYDQIAASGHARIEVERGGRLISMSFPLR